MSGFSEDPQNAPQVEMPRYKSHKVVHALKIQGLQQIQDNTNSAPSPILMIPAEPGYAPITLDSGFVVKHKPFVGGYYVVYPDGYKSFSPAKAFEDGYTKVT